MIQDRQLFSSAREETHDYRQTRLSSLKLMVIDDNLLKDTYKVTRATFVIKGKQNFHCFSGQVLLLYILTVLHVYFVMNLLFKFRLL